MKKRLLSIAISIITLAGLVIAPVLAAETTPSAVQNIVSGDIVTLSKDQVVDDDYYAGGGEVFVFGEVTGDAAIAGSTVEVSGTIGGDLLVGAGTVIVSGEVKQDARIVGGQVHISGHFGGNLWIFGGQMTISENTTIDGSLLIVGGLVTINGKVTKKAKVFATSINFNGRANDDVFFQGDTILIGDDAVIKGNLGTNYETEVNISEEATISGEIVKDKVEIEEQSFFDFGENFGFLTEGFLQGLNLVLKFISFLSIALIGLLLIILYPKVIDKVVATMNTNLGNTVIVGLFGFPVFGILIFFLFLTIIGIPLGLILVGLAMIVSYISRIFVGMYVGEKIFVWLKKENVTPAFKLLLGIFLLTLLGALPYIGWILGLLFLVFGMGGILVALNEARKK